MIKRIKKKELLMAFERLCKLFHVESAGFDRELITGPIDGDKHDGKNRWAMHFKKDSGWMIVSGAGGCGATFSRFNGYIKGRWNFLMFIEGLEQSAYYRI